MRPDRRCRPILSTLETRTAPAPIGPVPINTTLDPVGPIPSVPAPPPAIVAPVGTFAPPTTGTC